MPDRSAPPLRILCRSRSRRRRWRAATVPALFLSGPRELRNPRAAKSRKQRHPANCWTSPPAGAPSPPHRSARKPPGTESGETTERRSSAKSPGSAWLCIRRNVPGPNKKHRPGYSRCFRPGQAQGVQTLAQGFLPLTQLLVGHAQVVSRYRVARIRFDPALVHLNRFVQVAVYILEVVRVDRKSVV